MTKQEILDKFKDIDFAYNDSSKHETLSRMLDELLKEKDCNCCGTVFDVAYKAGKADAVVRCKDCRNGESINAGMMILCSRQKRQEMHDLDWFCADGERR